MRLTTPGRLLLEDAIPAKYRDGIGVIDSKVMKNIYTRIAQEDPDAYADSIKRFTDVGRDAVYRYGREASLGLDDLIPPPDIAKWREQIRQEATKIISTPGVSSKEKQRRLVEMLKDRIKEAPERLVKAYPSGANGLVEQTLSGARGNKNQLMQVLFGDVLVVDAQDKPVPIASLHGYGEGVTPLEYWAASSGSRKGSVSVQFSTAAGGYLGKQLSNLGHRLVVTARDCGTSNGFPVKADDPDNIGSILAAPAGNYPAGTVITKDILNKLGDKPIRVRSLTTCAMKDGVCSVCSGIREKGTLPPVGEQVGVVSSRALSEPITQAGLKCLHPDTPVRMADGSVTPIKDILIGDMVMGADIRGNAAPTMVINVFDNGIQPMYQYLYDKDKTHLGETVEITCTENHRIVCSSDDFTSTEEAPYGPLQKTPAGYLAEHQRFFYPVVSKGESYTVGKFRKAVPMGKCPAIDIEVDNKSHLFLLANGLIVSNSKHSGGVAGSDDKQVSGFKEMDQFIQVPENFQGGSVLSPIDGIVTRVENAPAGGSYVYVNGDRQYVPRETGVLVKQGDRVTAGDMLSEGTPNPAEIAKYKGIGEARRYFVDKYREILSRNGASVHRRNLEAVARGFISRVGIDDVDGYDGYLLGDVVPYDTFAADYEPRKDSRQMRPSSAKDSYLEKPYLHYSIGTRVTPSVSRDLEDAGVKEVIVNKAPPIFSPQIIRSRSILSTDPDWMTRLSGEGLKKSLLESTRMGATSTPAGTSYFPAMANPSEIDKYKGGTPTEKQPDNYIPVK